MALGDTRGVPWTRAHRGKVEDTDMLVAAETVAAAADIADVALEASAFVSAITDQASTETLTADAAAVANVVSGSSAEGAKEDPVAEVAAGRGLVSSTPP